MVILRLSDLRDKLETVTAGNCASLIALLDETTIGAVLKEKFRFSSVPLNEAINNRIQELSKLSETTLRNQLIKKISNSVGVLEPDTTPVSLIWMRSVVLTAYQSYGVDGNHLEDDALVKEFVDRVFREFMERVQASWEKLGASERQQIISSWIQSLEKSDLTEEQRKEVARAIGVDEISIDALKPAIVSTFLISLLSMGIAGSGFAVFLAATTLMHTVVTSLLGITLPFAAYTGLTSTMALLINPVTAIALVTGVVWQIGRKKNAELERQLLALVLLQIAYMP